MDIQSREPAGIVSEKHRIGNPGFPLSEVKKYQDKCQNQLDPHTHRTYQAGLFQILGEKDANYCK